jgi:transcriptional regulator with XRE-family HTH domain
MMDKDTREYLKNFGARTKYLRDQKDWSQQGLADSCKLKKSVISDIENGKKEVCLKNRRKLYKGLGVTEFEFQDIPELRKFTGAPVMKHLRQCPFAKCRRLCFDSETPTP